MRVTHRLIDQFLNPSCVPPRAVRNVKRDDVIRAGFKHVIWAILLQVALVSLLATMRRVKLGPVANLPPRVEIIFAGTRIIETF